MEILDSAAGFVVDDDLLDFSLEGGAEENESVVLKDGASDSYSSMESSHPATASFKRDARGGPFPEFVEEELEWLSNKDAFPGVETCFGILADNPELILNHQSPVSVLENSSGSSNSSASSNGNGSTIASYCSGLKVPGNFPVRPRSKRQRRKRAGCAQLPSQQCLWLNQANIKQEALVLSPPSRTLTAGRAGMGRRCLHCQADKTPQWRAGPMGPKTLCNACGVRYKSGRLLPEYRPASSPTFSCTLHSNSHRKVVEMRRKKQLPSVGGVTASETCGYMG